MRGGAPQPDVQAPPHSAPHQCINLHAFVFSYRLRVFSTFYNDNSTMTRVDVVSNTAWWWVEHLGILNRYDRLTLGPKTTL